MNNRHTNTTRTICAVCGIVLWCTTGAGAGDLPPDPDNAALLYYQAFLLCPEPTVPEVEALDEVYWGAGPDETVRAGVSKYEEAFDLAVAASERPSCRWGVPFSQGYRARLPQTVQIGHLTLWMDVSARILAADGDHRKALERCLALRRFAGHVGDDTLLLYWYSLLADTRALRTMQHVLGATPPDAHTLAWLQSQFAAIPGVPRSAARAVEIDLEMTVQSLRTDPNALAWIRERLSTTVQNGDLGEAQSLTDEELIALVRKPYDDFLNATLRLIDSDMPYEEAYPQIKEMVSTLRDEVRGGPVTGLLEFWPHDGVLNGHRAQVQHKSLFHAVKAALEIYRVAAETRQLPEALPSFLPKDPYSNEDFEYEITEDGFILRCRGKEIDADVSVFTAPQAVRNNDCIADKIHEYEFKVTW